MGNFTPIDSKLLFSRQDKSDPRLGEKVQPQATDAQVCVLGYPDDEGIRLNGGREGAKDGPDSIRHWLYRMTPHPQRELQSFSDLGNLSLTGDLNARHESAAAEVASCLKKNQKVLTFGGGNDYAYADGLGFLKAVEGQPHKPLIINIDAHLDVRTNGINSGTPFFRLLESEHKFDFVELGIQGHCNAKAHWDYVAKKGGKILTTEQIYSSGVSLIESTTTLLGDWLLKPRPTFLAIDIDAFAWPFAEGSSASWPLGLLPHDFMPLLNLLLKRLNVRVMGIYEVAPGLETNSGTSKLAAQWAHMFLHNV